MRRVYENDIKNRVTTVTEFSLTRNGVKKNSYMTDFSNTNLVELDSSMKDAIVDTIATPISNIAENMMKTDSAPEFKPILCMADKAVADLTLTSPTFIEYATLEIYKPYSMGTVIEIFAETDDGESIPIASATLNELNLSSYPIEINYYAENASPDNHVTISVIISNNTETDSSAILSYKFREFKN